MQTTFNSTTSLIINCESIARYNRKTAKILLLGVFIHKSAEGQK